MLKTYCDRNYNLKRRMIVYMQRIWIYNTDFLKYTSKNVIKVNKY